MVSEKIPTGPPDWPPLRNKTQICAKIHRFVAYYPFGFLTCRSEEDRESPGEQMGIAASKRPGTAPELM